MTLKAQLATTIKNLIESVSDDEPWIVELKNQLSSKSATDCGFYVVAYAILQPIAAEQMERQRKQYLAQQRNQAYQLILNGDNTSALSMLPSKEQQHDMLCKLIMHGHYAQAVSFYGEVEDVDCSNQIFEVGDYVCHPELGYGIVVNASHGYITVRFAADESELSFLSYHVVNINALQSRFEDFELQ